LATIADIPIYNFASVTINNYFMNKTDVASKAKYVVDAEYLEGFYGFVAKIPVERPVYKEYWQEVSANNDLFYEKNIEQFPIYEDVSSKSYFLTTSDQAEIEMKWYEKKGKKSESAVVYYHGGGRIAGNIKLFEPLIQWYVHHSGVSFLLVEYRIAPSVSAKRSIDDCFEAFQWLKSKGSELGINSNRIGIMGESGGGGIAAGVAIMARENDIQLAHQILVYPMLDDRRSLMEKHIAEYQLLSNHDLYICWEAALGEVPGSDGISEIVSPGRLENFEGLAPAFISVGFFDNLRQESMEYAERLLKAGVSIEFHLYPNVPHAFDLVAPEAAVSKRAFADYLRIIKSI
jgi:acetyl esterase/lipase